MVRAMRVAVAQMDIAWMDRAANWATIRRMVGSANLSKGDYLLLPELADTGFTMDPPPEAGPDPMRAAEELARAHGLWVQMGHAERAADGAGFVPGSQPRSVGAQVTGQLGVSRHEADGRPDGECPLV